MIYLTEPKDLTSGLWWARQVIGEPHLSKRGAWCIVQITGDSPFLSKRIVLYCTIEGRWVDLNGELGGFGNMDTLEYGPRIIVPGDKDRAEYAPRPAKEVAR